MNLWAVRGEYTDIYSDEEILLNHAHFSFWLYHDCMEGGKEKFNLDFLGKWRSNYYQEIVQYKGINSCKNENI
jgi:hypothetical protein